MRVAANGEVDVHARIQGEGIRPFMPLMRRYSISVATRLYRLSVGVQTGLVRMRPFQPRPNTLPTNGKVGGSTTYATLSCTCISLQSKRELLNVVYGAFYGYPFTVGSSIY
jgi:fluoride ion exporter CrcB/FEX